MNTCLNEAESRVEQVLNGGLNLTFPDISGISVSSPFQLRLYYHVGCVQYRDGRRWMLSQIYYPERNRVLLEGSQERQYDG